MAHLLWRTHLWRRPCSLYSASATVSSFWSPFAYAVFWCDFRLSVVGNMALTLAVCLQWHSFCSFPSHTEYSKVDFCRCPRKLRQTKTSTPCSSVLLNWLILAYYFTYMIFFSFVLSFMYYYNYPQKTPQNLKPQKHFVTDHIIALINLSYGSIYIKKESEGTYTVRVLPVLFDTFLWCANMNPKLFFCCCCSTQTLLKQ